MQVNKIQSPSFGKITIHKSAHPILEHMSNRHITEIFEQAADIQKTQHWDLFVKGHKTPVQFYMYFINKEDSVENSFVQGLLPFKQDGAIVHAIGTDANPYSDLNNMYELEFANEQRAKEVYNFLNQPEPKSDIDVFARAVETIKILEEASEPKQYKEQQNQSFFHKLLRWLQK